MSCSCTAERIGLYKLIRHSLLLFLLLLHGVFAFSQTFDNLSNNDFRFSHLSVDDGLSPGAVNCFYKQKSGFLWIGTRSGLNRYDGYTIKTFNPDPANENALQVTDYKAIFEDPLGNIWTRTPEGINIFNPSTQRFTSDQSAILRELGLAQGGIQEIYKDRHGDFWFIYQDGSLGKFIAETQEVINNSSYNNSWPDHEQILAFVEDKKGNLWILWSHAVLQQIDTENLKVNYTSFVLQEYFASESTDFQLVLDDLDNLWIYHSADEALYRFNLKTEQISNYTKKHPQNALTNSRISYLEKDDQGNIWVGTDHAGIAVINTKTLEADLLQNNKEIRNSLSHNSITALYKDQEGIMWIGTYKNGADYYHPNIHRFPLYTRRLTDPESLPFNDVNVFEEDEKGNIYIGTNGGGLLYWDRKTGKYRRFLHDPDDPQSLSSNVIVSLLYDSDNTLWVGTYLGGLNKMTANGFKRFKTDPNDLTSIAENNVWELLEDSQGNFWLGTINHGLELFDRKKEVFYHSGEGKNRFKLQNTYIAALAEDEHGTIWVGGSRGIDVFNLRKNSQDFLNHKPGDTTSLSGDFVFSIFTSTKGTVWVGTQNGLDHFNPDKKTFSSYTIADGLPGEKIIGIVADNNDDLWLTSFHGIAQVALPPENLKENSKLPAEIKVYKKEDGLQDNLFNENAVFKTREGEILVGGLHGYNQFDPEDLSFNTSVPSIVFTDFSLFNKSLQPQENNDDGTILKKPIHETSEIRLQYDENLFSITFAALDFFQPSKNQYRYKLEGFDKQWHHANSDVRKATYTNLDPGNYTFKVQASNNDQLWNTRSKQLKITILPPFYKTIWAYCGYVLLVILVLYLARQRIIRRQRISFQVEQERREAAHLHKIDEMRIRFFTQISQEFKNPLAQILRPVQHLRKRNLDKESSTYVQLIDDNIQKLLQLINPIIELGNLKSDTAVNKSTADVVGFLSDGVEALQNQAQARNIELKFSSDPSTFQSVFDTDKLDKIIFNLVSNALKFTPDGGTISVVVHIENNEENENNQQLTKLKLSVEDTGIGIVPEEQMQIFDRFFKGNHPGYGNNSGSGIGLALVQQYIHLLGGSIAVHSIPQEGTRFLIELPLLRPEETVTTVNGKMQEQSERTGTNESKPNLLVIDKNRGFLNQILSEFEAFYNVFIATDAKTGWKKTLSVKPDLLLCAHKLSDINGIDLCLKLKADARTKHIPVILYAEEKDETLKLQALQAGSNDYIEKPFQFEVLQSRMKNLIDQRKSLQQIYSKKLELSESEELKIESEDEKLMRKVLSKVEANFSNPDFSVEKLAELLGVSRSFLYKKTVALFEKSPSELITDIRLEKGKELLKKSQLTIAEIAFKTGFNNPKYFTKNFKRKMHMLPSAYKNKYAQI